METTPGPWSINKQPKNAGRRLWIGGADQGAGFQQEVADIYTHHPNAQGNASLIMNAPELLRLLGNMEADYAYNRSDEARIETLKEVRKLLKELRR